MTFEELGIKNDMPKGWLKEKSHMKIYDMWRSMWRRIYSSSYYYDCSVIDDWRLLSNYYNWFITLPNYQNFLDNLNLMWCIDKDDICPGNRCYCPEYCTLMLQSDNTKERLMRCGNPFSSSDIKRVCNFNEKARVNSGLSRRKPVIGRGVKIILLMSAKDGKKFGFAPSNITNCLKKRYFTHKGYKWYYINYKHNKRYRRV